MPFLSILPKLTTQRKKANHYYNAREHILKGLVLDYSVFIFNMKVVFSSVGIYCSFLKIDFFIDPEVDPVAFLVNKNLVVKLKIISCECS